MQTQVSEQILERGIDREYPTHRELLTDISLILAVTNGREIVVGADSLAYEGDQTLYRTYPVPKLRIVNGCHWIMAFSGLGQAAWNVWESVEATGLILNSDIRIGAMECIDQMGQAYTRYRVPLGAKVLDASNIWQGRLNYGCTYATIMIHASRRECRLAQNSWQKNCRCL